MELYVSKRNQLPDSDNDTDTSRSPVDVRKVHQISLQLVSKAIYLKKLIFMSCLMIWLIINELKRLQENPNMQDYRVSNLLCG